MQDSGASGSAPKDHSYNPPHGGVNLKILKHTGSNPALQGTRPWVTLSQQELSHCKGSGGESPVGPLSILPMLGKLSGPQQGQGDQAWT